MDIQKLIEELKRRLATPCNADLRGRKIIEAVPALLDYIAQLEAERDAVVAGITSLSVCDQCKRDCQGDAVCINNGWMNFEWRKPAQKG